MPKSTHVITSGGKSPIPTTRSTRSRTKKLTQQSKKAVDSMTDDSDDDDITDSSDDDDDDDMTDDSDTTTTTTKSVEQHNHMSLGLFSKVMVDKSFQELTFTDAAGEPVEVQLLVHGSSTMKVTVPLPHIQKGGFQQYHVLFNTYDNKQKKLIPTLKMTCDVNTDCHYTHYHKKIVLPANRDLQSLKQKAATSKFEMFTRLKILKFPENLHHATFEQPDRWLGRPAGKVLPDRYIHDRNKVLQWIERIKDIQGAFFYDELRRAAFKKAMTANPPIPYTQDLFEKDATIIDNKGMNDMWCSSSWTPLFCPTCGYLSYFGHCSPPGLDHPHHQLCYCNQCQHVVDEMEEALEMIADMILLAKCNADKTIKGLKYP